MNKFALTVENLTKIYSNSKDKKQNKALNELNFNVKQGEVFGLLGPNGAGKSTTFSMIAMQLPITSGQAELMGHELLEFPLDTMGKFFGQCN